MEDKKIEILKLSVSAIKTYESCGLKYFYNYIDKQPKKDWEHFTLGSLSHKALEEFHRYLIKDPSLDHKKVMKESFMAAMKEFPKATQASLVSAKGFLKDYLDFMQVSPPAAIEVEQGFNMKISENVLMRGFIDRLDYKDGMYHIADYKTSKDEKYLEPFQLQAYGIWLRNEFGIKEYTASYVMLRHKIKHITYKFNLDDIKKCEDKILEFADKITESKITQNWVPMVSNLCYFCDFKEICPTQQNNKKTTGTW